MQTNSIELKKMFETIASLTDPILPIPPEKPQKKNKTQKKKIPKKLCVPSTTELLKHIKTFERDQKTEQDLKILSDMFTFSTDAERHSIQTVNDEGIVASVESIASKYIQQAGFATQSPEMNNILVEKHCYMSDDEKGASSQLCWHVDNEGPLCSDVVACFFYLEHTFAYGGELVLADNDRHDGDVQLECLIVDPRRFAVVVIDGNVEHTVMNCLGKGVRKSITFHIKKK